jgi:diadenylate cyclase
MAEAIAVWWRPALEIALLWLWIYGLLLFLKDTRGVQVLTGLLVIIVLFVITQRIGLVTIQWLFTKVVAISLIGLLVLFQPELRRLLGQLGQHRLLRGWSHAEQAADELVDALRMLSQQRHGALIALERQTPLKPYVESGVALDGRISHELLCTVFTPNGPLHDGGVIIAGDRLLAAGCLFPLSQSEALSKSVGTRHRAAVGLSEETDAAVLIVSEETGAIAVAVSGQLSRNVTPEAVGAMVRAFYQPPRHRGAATMLGSGGA